MNSHVTQGFRKLMAALPPEVRRQARAAYRQFMENPRHPGLQLFAQGQERQPPCVVLLSESSVGEECHDRTRDGGSGLELP